jgi:hypothetical protein
VTKARRLERRRGTALHSGIWRIGVAAILHRCARTSLDAAGEAHAYIEARRNKGKAVLEA